MTQVEQKFQDAGWLLEHHAKKIVGIFQSKHYDLVSKSFVEEGYTYEEELEEAYNQVIEKGLINK